MLCYVADRAIQVFGGAGITDDFPLAHFYTMVAGCRWPTDQMKCAAVRWRVPR